MKLKVMYTVFKLSMNGRDWIEVADFEKKEEALSFIMFEGKEFPDEPLKVETIYCWSEERL